MSLHVLLVGGPGMTSALVAYAVLVHGLVAVGAVVRRLAGRDPLRADREREDLRRALARTAR